MNSSTMKAGETLFLVCALDGFNHVVIRAGAYHGINLGKLFENLLLIALGKTAGHNDPFEGTIFFKPCDVKNVIDRFLLCGLYEGAGIDHNNIRVDILGDDLTSGFRKL